MSKEKITISNYINTSSATTPDQGNNVYYNIKALIANCIENNTEFIINFDNITTLTTAFLNNAIGKLFFDFEIDSLLSLMSFSGLSNTTQIKTLKLTLSNALALSKAQNESTT